jgi:hypothetical protein
MSKSKEDYHVFDLILIGNPSPDSPLLLSDPTCIAPDKKIFLQPVHPRGGLISKAEWVGIKNKVDFFFSTLSGRKGNALKKALEDCLRSSAEEQSKAMEVFAKSGKIKKSSGHIYILKAKTNLFKIGRSKSPESRIKFLAVKLPFPIKTAHCFLCDDAPVAEQKLHDHFNNKRLEGEWFRLCKKDISGIMAASGYKYGLFFSKDGKILLQENV